MYVTSVGADVEIAEKFLQTLLIRRFRGRIASANEILHGVRGELAFARMLGREYLDENIKHHLREIPTEEDLQYDIKYGDVLFDVKTTSERATGSNLIVSHRLPHVTYVLLEHGEYIVGNIPYPVNYTVVGITTGSASGWARREDGSYFFPRGRLIGMK